MKLAIVCVTYREGNTVGTVEEAGRDPAKPLRVMLVEDHEHFRGVIAALVNRQPDLEVVAEAGSLDEARRHTASIGFEVVVLDLRLPDGNGIDLIAELRGASPGAAVLVLSATLDPTNLARAKEAGAEDMLDKFATPGEISDAIRNAATAASRRR
jgi:DNA-binding NarL/FixJ family response regulator